MDYNNTENTKKHLRKKYKDWSEEKIETEAKRILEKYVLDNKDRLEKEAKKNKERFEETLDREFTSLYLDYLED